MTFIPTVGNAIGPIVVVFVLAGRPRPRPDAAGPARSSSATRSSIGRRPGGSTRSPSRAAAGWRSAPRSCWSPAPSCSSTRAAQFVPVPTRLLADRRSRRCCSAGRSRRGSAPSTTCSTCGRAGSCSARSRWRAGRSPSGSASTSSPTRSAAVPIRFTAGPVAAGADDLLDRRDDQQHQLDRRPRRAVDRRRVHRGRDARAHQPHHAGRRPAADRRPVLRARRRAARVPALELPPGLDLHRDERRPVRRLHAGRAADPRDGQGRGRAAGPRRADHRHVLDHRPADLSRAARRSARTARTSTTGCSTSG